MSKHTRIEWTDATWNPVTGCTPVSPGCSRCYARRMAARLQAMGKAAYANGFAVTMHPDALMDPAVLSLRRAPRMIFTCSMGDLFHERVSEGFIAQVFQTMELAERHTFQVLTKRPWRAADLAGYLAWPPNLWMGVSIEDNAQLDRIKPLLVTPVRTHFLSLEPLLGAIPALPLEGIDWVIVGGETGAGSRPLHPGWVSQVRDQCVGAGVPFFFKSWGDWAPLVPYYPETAEEMETFEVLEYCGTMVALELSGDTPEGARGNGSWCHNQPAPGTWWMKRVGKRSAGRMLEQRTWEERP